MSPDKTEAIVIGTSARKRMKGLDNTVDLGCVSVGPVSNIRSLGVTIAHTLSFNEHVDNVCKSCNFHIRALCHIRRHISEDAAKTIACSIVNGRQDYCNSLSHRTSSCNINKLQRVQNSVALSSQDDGYRTTSHQFLQISTGYQFSTASSISLQL